MTQDTEGITIEHHRATVRQAISDPGAFLPRGDNYTEYVTAWQLRALLCPNVAPSLRALLDDTEVSR